MSVMESQGMWKRKELKTCYKNLKLHPREVRYGICDFTVFSDLESLIPNYLIVHNVLNLSSCYIHIYFNRS